jgi:hypothetical protein
MGVGTVRLRAGISVKVRYDFPSRGACDPGQVTPVVTPPGQTIVNRSGATFEEITYVYQATNPFPGATFVAQRFCQGFGTINSSGIYIRPPRSCIVGHCGEQSADGCWCDSDCFGFNDCCDEVKTLCPLP